VNPIGIYIHIPFCERKCTYCSFNTTDYLESISERYSKAVCKEIAYWRDYLGAESESDIEVDSIYLGGGTPSIIPAAQLATVLECCYQNFNVLPSAEVTIEINPGTFSIDKPNSWLAAGINRASVGVQSFIDRELAALSRTHTAHDARRTIEILRRAGFQNLSLDLIAGLPDQTLDDWEFNLREALALAPEHLSLYLLEIKQGTQLHMQIEREKRPRPDDDVAAEMYRMICSATRQSGYEQYEISNFARLEDQPLTGRYRSAHNLKYWTGDRFYGIGCGAHSYDGRSRWVNILQAENYIRSIEATGHAIFERRELSAEDRAAEALFMALRLNEGLDLVQFQTEYGIDVLERYSSELPRLTEAGLLEMGNGRMALTDAGRLLSNEVFVSFIYSF